LYCIVEILDDKDTMAVAWRRFDSDVGQLKRLSAQISGQDSSSVPATIRSLSRRQSAANRRALTSLHPNVPPQTSPVSSTSESEALMSQMSDSVVQLSRMLPQISQQAPTVTDTVRPCNSKPGVSTTLVQSTSRDSCHPTATVCLSHSDSVPTSSAVTDMELEPNAMYMSWPDQVSSHSANESVHLIMSPSRSRDVSYVSATVTSVAVTTVSTCQQAAHSISTETGLRRLSSPNHPQAEG